MPNLYDFPAPLSGVNQGLQNLQQGLMQAQQMRGMQQEMQGQGMRNQLYQMQLNEAQKEQQNKEGLVSQLKSSSQNPLWKQTADYWQSKGDSQKALAAMQIGKVEEELNANPAALKYADMLTKLRKADKTGHLLKTMWPSIANQFPEQSKGVNVEDIIKHSQAGVTAQPIKGTNLLVLYDEDGQRLEIKEKKSERKITSNITAKGNYLYDTGEESNIKAGVKPKEITTTQKEANAMKQIEFIAKLAKPATSGGLNLLSLTAEDITNSPDIFKKVSDFVKKNPQFKEKWEGALNDLGIKESPETTTSSDWKKYLK